MPKLLGSRCYGHYSRIFVTENMIMNIQYISDNIGLTTAVVIPIEEWNQITEKYPDLKSGETQNQLEKKLKPSDFAGKMSKETAEKFQEYIKNTRNEWDRD